MKLTTDYSHVTLAGIVTILTALIYVSVQQVYRSGANDPQLQLARDMSARLNKGTNVDKWFRDDTIDISESLDVFNTLYNENREPVLSTGLLNGKMPLLPVGVFEFAGNNGENVFTWQPQAKVRIAMVLKSLRKGPYAFLAVGRSLCEAEKREKNHLWMVFAGWLMSMTAILGHWVLNFLKSTKHAH